MWLQCATTARPHGNNRQWSKVSASPQQKRQKPQAKNQKHVTRTFYHAGSIIAGPALVNTGGRMDQSDGRRAPAAFLYIGWD